MFTKIFDEFLNGAPSKFLQICSGCLVVVLLFLIYFENFKYYILFIDRPEFTYLSIITLILASTFLMYLFIILIESFLIKIKNMINFYSICKTLYYLDTSKKSTILRRAHQVQDASGIVSKKLAREKYESEFLNGIYHITSWSEGETGLVTIELTHEYKQFVLNNPSICNFIGMKFARD